MFRGWNLVYLIAGTGLVGLWTWADLRGWEASAGERATIEPNVRQSPGGWRSWTFWHSGLHGGK